MYGPSTASPTDVLRALETGGFFRLLDGDGHPYYMGRCRSTNGADSQNMFAPLDDFGRGDVDATIQYHHNGRWTPL